MAIKIRAHRDLSFYMYNTDPDKIGRYDELTEEQRIAEGTRQPYYVRPDFKKTPEEREELARMKNSAMKSDSPGMLNVTPSFPYRATIHLYNNKGKKDFKTTHTIDIPVEYLHRYMIDHFRTVYSRKTDSSIVLPINRVIRKVVYNGETIIDNGKKGNS